MYVISRIKNGGLYVVHYYNPAKVGGDAEVGIVHV